MFQGEREMLLPFRSPKFRHERMSTAYKNKLGGWNVVKIKDIKLPEKDSKIDFAFMEAFISAIKKLAIKEVVLYSDRKIAATKEVISKTE